MSTVHVITCETRPWDSCTFQSVTTLVGHNHQAHALPPVDTYHIGQVIGQFSQRCDGVEKGPMDP